MGPQVQPKCSWHPKHMRNNWELKKRGYLIRFGHTEALLLKKKRTLNGHFSHPAETDPYVKELSSSSRPGDKFQDCIHSLISLLVFHFIKKFRLLLMWLRSELKMWIKLCMQCMTWMMSLLLQYKLAGFSLAKAGWGTSPIGQSTVRRIDPLQTSLYFHSSARVSNSWG